MRPSFLPLLLVVSACGGGSAPSSDRARARTTRAEPAASASRNTGAFPARQQGEPIAAPAPSTVMELRLAGRGLQLVVENEAGQRASAGSPGTEPMVAIAGSRASTMDDDTSSAASSATVTAPVLAGEHYLVEVAAAPPRAERGSLERGSLELASDGRRLARSDVALDSLTGTATLVEVVIGDGTLWVSPAIERVEIVPACGTTHVIRSGGRADLYARYEVSESGERGDVHLPPRDADARFRAVTLHTRTPGTLRLTYLGHELASVARPESCPAY
jgi:hypothetical protein